MFIKCVGVALLAVGPSLVPSAPTRYRIEQRTENRLDLSVFGQPEQVQTSTFAWYVTVTYTDSAGGAVMHAVLDSLQVDLGPQEVTQASLDSATGTVYHGYTSATRKVERLAASKVSLFGAQFESVLRSFHPSWRRDASTGEKWTDTLMVELNTPAIKTNSQSVRHYTIAGSEPWDGAPATRLDVVYQEEMTGSLETPAGPAELSGKSTGTSTWYVTPDGRYLGGKSSSQGDGNIQLTTAPSPIPIKSTTTTSVSVMK